MSGAKAVGEVVGIMIGIIVVIIVVICIFKFANKDGTSRAEYDERQEMLRGRGYRYGFYAMAICEGLLAALSLSGVELPMEGCVVHFITLFTGVLVQVGYCVWKDAYWGMNNDRKRYMIVFLLVGILNLLYPVRELLNGTLVVEGKLQSSFINFLCSVIFIIIGLELLIKKWRDAKTDRDGE